MAGCTQRVPDLGADGIDEAAAVAVATGGHGVLRE